MFPYVTCFCCAICHGSNRQTGHLFIASHHRAVTSAPCDQHTWLDNTLHPYASKRTQFFLQKKTWFNKSHLLQAVDIGCCWTHDQTRQPVTCWSTALSQPSSNGSWNHFIVCFTYSTNYQQHPATTECCFKEVQILTPTNLMNSHQRPSMPQTNGTSDPDLNLVVLAIVFLLFQGTLEHQNVFLSKRNMANDHIIIIIDKYQISGSYHIMRFMRGDGE